MDASRQISVPELAKRLGCSVPRAQTLIRTGRIAGHKNAWGWVTTVVAVEEYLKDCPKKSAHTHEEIKK